MAEKESDVLLKKFWLCDGELVLRLAFNLHLGATDGVEGG